MGGKKKNLIGETFGRLTVVDKIYKTSARGNSYPRWVCVCSCGSGKISYVTSYDLMCGHTRSCGCLRNEKAADRGRKMWKKYNTYDLSGPFGIGYTFDNKEFYFDLEDYDKIKNYCWHISKDGYVLSMDVEEKHIVRIHRLIMGYPKGFDIDHINHKMNDNRKENLRVCEHMKNMMNQSKRSDNTSGVVGVNFHKSSGMWHARIGVNGKRIDLGLFDNFDDAVHARKQAEEKYYGKFSYDNSTRGDCNELQ